MSLKWQNSFYTNICTPDISTYKSCAKDYCTKCQCHLSQVLNILFCSFWYQVQRDSNRNYHTDLGRYFIQSLMSTFFKFHEGKNLYMQSLTFNLWGTHCFNAKMAVKYSNYLATFYLVKESLLISVRWSIRCLWRGTSSTSISTKPIKLIKQPMLLYLARD